jgi:hypothetical protein
LVGVSLAIASLYSYLARINFKVKHFNYRFFFALAGFLGIILYCLYLNANFYDPFLFLSSQAYWKRELMDPISTVVGYLVRMFSFQNVPINDYFDLLTTLSFIAILILGARKITSSMWIFSMLVILIPASTGTLTSMPRYVISSLGTFIILGIYLKDRDLLRKIVWVIFLTSQAVLASLFVNGFWIA